MVSSPKYKVDISPHSVSIGYLHAATFLCTYFNVVYSNESTEKPEFIHPLPLVRAMFQLQAIPAMMRAGVSPGQGYFFFLTKHFKLQVCYQT